MTRILRWLMDVLRPTPGKLIFFPVFAFLWVAGVTQTYAFIDDIPGVEKPPLYDVLRPFGFWFPWLIFSAPLYIVSGALCSLHDFCSPPPLDVSEHGRREVSGDGHNLLLPRLLMDELQLE